MSIKMVWLCVALAVVPFVRLNADTCIISGSTNRTFSARGLSAEWAEFETGPSDTAFSQAWSKLDSRLNTIDMTSGRNLLRERSCFTMLIR